MGGRRSESSSAAPASVGPLSPATARSSTLWVSFVLVVLTVLASAVVVVGCVGLEAARRGGGHGAVASPVSLALGLVGGAEAGDVEEPLLDVAWRVSAALVGGSYATLAFVAWLATRGVGAPGPPAAAGDKRWARPHARRGYVSPRYSPPAGVDPPSSPLSRTRSEPAFRCLS